MTLIDPDKVGVSICDKAERQQIAACIRALNAQMVNAQVAIVSTANAVSALAERPPLPTLLTTAEGLSILPTEQKVLQVNSTLVRTNGQWDLSKIGTPPPFNGVVMLDDEGPGSARESIRMGRLDQIHGHAMMLEALRLAYGCPVMSYWMFETLPWGGGQMFSPTEAMLACISADYLCMSAYLALSIHETGMADAYRSMIDRATALGRRAGKPIVWSLMGTYMENWTDYPQYAGHIIPPEDSATLASWIKSAGCIPMDWDSTEQTIRVFSGAAPLDQNYTLFKAALTQDAGATPLYPFMRQHAQNTIDAIRSAA
jgi:hypothetical protein